MSNDQSEEVEITPRLLKIRSGQFTLTSITTLNLSHLGIASLTRDLQECRYLKRLYLDHNLIENIEHIDALPNLEYLDLSFNQISRIPSASLEGLKKLTTLKMEGNLIRSLTELESLSILPVLRHVNFAQNPIAKVKNYDEKLKAHVKQLAIIDGEHILLRIPSVEWNNSEKMFEIMEQRPWDQDDFKKTIFTPSTEGEIATQFSGLVTEYKNFSRECQRLVARADSILESL